MPRIKQLTAVRLGSFIDQLVTDLTAPPAPLGPNEWSYPGGYPRPAVLSHTPESLVEDASDVEFDREQLAAWRQMEFAGPACGDDHPDNLVFDDAGELAARELLFDLGCSQDEVDELQPEPPRVMAWELADARSRADHLRRSGGRNRQHRFEKGSPVRRSRDIYREGVNGEPTVVGAHPFSTDEGSAEWLSRARIEMRFLYAEAKSDAERSAVRAREAALRARHNARCWARAFARYHRLDEGDTLRMLNAWQKSNPIGWLGLEKAMKSLFESCLDHYYEERDAWNSYGDNLPVSWLTGQVEQSTKDEWLDREPQLPLYPEHLVTSAKVVRREERPVARTGEVGRTGTAPELAARRRAEAEHQASAEERVRLEAHRVRVSRGNVRRWARESETEWWSARKEWELAEQPDFLPAPSVPFFEIGDGVEWQRGHLYA